MFLIFPVFTKNLCSQMSAISGPLLQWLEDRLEQNKQRVQELQQEKEQLLEELAALEWRRICRPFRRETWGKKKVYKIYSWLKGGPTLPYSKDTSCASSLASCSKEHCYRIRALSAQLDGKQWYLSRCCMMQCDSSSVVGLGSTWRVFSSGGHIPRQHVVSPFPIFWQKSYCFTCIPRA